MRKFWDGIAQWFGYDSWAWGTAADWVAGLGTVGALVLGIALLWKEQRERELSLASLVIITTQRTHSMVEGIIVCRQLVRIANRSPLPIHQLVVVTFRRDEGLVALGGTVVRKSSGKARERLHRFPGEGGAMGELDAGHSTTLTIDYNGVDADGSIFVTFKDGAGRNWVQDLARGTRSRKSRSYTRKLKQDFPEELAVEVNSSWSTPGLKKVAIKTRVLRAYKRWKLKKILALG